jgi:prephenate dehydrogenase
MVIKMEESRFSILVVGLGLIGGSLAKALKGFRKALVYGVDKDKDVIKQAIEDGVIENGFEDISRAPACELTVLCVKPELTLNMLKNAQFTDGGLVTDVCGVKQYIEEAGKNRNFRYIGGHPMAGKEVGGYANSDAKLFKNASYLLTPPEDALDEDIMLLKDMAAHIGCRKTVITTTKEHDEMIAYTSQLMHVVAAALCDNPLLDNAEGFSAGSLRDCTRVAKMDSRMWTELFMANKEALAKSINSFEKSLDTVKAALDNNDRDALLSFLENSSSRKRRYLNEDTSC